MLSALAYLQSLRRVQGDALRAVGFGAGGGNVWNLALNMDALSAAVPFYGAPVPSLDALPALSTPALAIYAELDRNLTRIISGASSGSRSCRTHSAATPTAAHVTRSTTTPAQTHDRDAAKDAWRQTTAFLRKHLPSQETPAA